MTVAAATAAYDRALAHIRRTYRGHKAAPTGETASALEEARAALRRAQADLGRAKDADYYERRSGQA